MANNCYYYRRGERIFGPYPLTQLRRMLSEGSITVDTPLSADKRLWCSAASVFGISPMMTAPPPPPPPQEPDPSVRILGHSVEEETAEYSAPHQESSVQVIACTLELLWNTTERVPWMLSNVGPQKSFWTFLTSYLFVMLVAIPTWITASKLNGHWGLTFLFLTMFFIVQLLLILVELMLLKLCFPNRPGHWRDVWLLSGFVAENLALFAAMPLLVPPALNLLAERPVLVLLLKLGILFYEIFFVANLTSGLSRGIARTCRIRTQSGQWCAVFLTGQIFWLTYLFWFLIRQYLQ